MTSSRKASLPTIIRTLRDAAGTGPGLAQHLLALPRLVRAARRGDYRRRSSGGVAPLVAAAIYVLSPVDLLPELFLPFIGLIDDAVVLTWLVGRLLGETGEFLLWEKNRWDEPDRPGGAGSLSTDAAIVPPSTGRATPQP